MDDYNARRLEREEGKAEGLKLGIRQGKKEGLKEGEVIGVTNATKGIAFKMLQEGEPMEKIVKFTGLSIAEIQKLKDTK